MMLATNDMQCAGQGWGGDPSWTRRACREGVVVMVVVVVVLGGKVVVVVVVREWARRARMSLEMVQTVQMVQLLQLLQRPILMQHQGHDGPRAWWLKESAVHAPSSPVSPHRGWTMMVGADGEGMEKGKQQKSRQGKQGRRGRAPWGWISMGGGAAGWC